MQIQCVSIQTGKTKQVVAQTTWQVGNMNEDQQEYHTQRVETEGYFGLLTKQTFLFGDF